jgi:hypothetical protein
LQPNRSLVWGATPSIANTLRHRAANDDEDLWFCRVSGSKEKAIENARSAEFVPAVPGSTDLATRVEHERATQAGTRDD